MTKITCKRLIAFDAGHRVVGHEGKCKYIHGHRYTIEAEFEASRLDNIGRVVDFGAVKKILGDWIDQNWDHTCVLWSEDKTLGESISALTQQKIYYMPSNPTAENMAQYLLEHICPKLFAEFDVHCSRITIHETPNCSASAEF